MMLALCDCNNFYVSCERIFRPDLRESPVVVLSGNDGCVVARSNEVKRLNIKMGTPFYQMKEAIQKHGIVHFSSNFALYGDISSRIMRILNKHTPDMQQYSIDEAFLDLSYMTSWEAVKQLCLELRAYIYRGVGVPVSFGIASSKTLCKVASYYAKHYAGYRGVCLIDSEEKRVKALSAYPIEEVWGIGRRMSTKLKERHIDTAIDFADLTCDTVKSFMAAPYVNTWKELNGENCIETRDLPEKQTITCSRTFAHGVTDKIVLEHEFIDFCARVAQKLRNQHSVCRQMVAFANTSRFVQPFDNFQSVVTFPIPTANLHEMVVALLRSVRQQWKPATPYKRAGVIALMIQHEKNAVSLFNFEKRQKDAHLQQTLDNINRQYGHNAIIYTNQLCPKSKEAIYRATAKSPEYTTLFSDILTLKC